MKEILNSLKDIKILQTAEVVLLRAYIQKKFHDVDPNELDAILTDAVQKVIRGRLPAFDDSAQAIIESQLVQRVIHGEEISITGTEVFQECLANYREEAGYSNAMLEWLNRVQPLKVTFDMIHSFTGGRGRDVILASGQGSAGAEEVAALADDHDLYTGLFDLDRLPEDESRWDEHFAYEEFEEDEEDGVLWYVNIWTLFLTFFVRAFHELGQKIDDRPPLSVRFAAWSETVVRNTNAGWQHFSGVIRATTAEIRRPRTIALSVVTAFCLLFLYVVWAPLLEEQPRSATLSDTAPAGQQKSIDLDMGNQLPPYLQYSDVNRQQLKSYLAKRNSILQEEPYFTEIMNAARDYNIHPLLLFAIAGQEQSFVPKSGDNAQLIANNPFNIKESWRKYNTDIRASSRLVAAALLRMSQDRPEGSHPLAWINRKYAEDNRWWVGVSTLFLEMSQQVTQAKTLRV